MEYHEERKVNRMVSLAHKNETDLKRLEGSMQAIQYVAYGKMPGDGNHDKFKDHKPHGS